MSKILKAISGTAAYNLDQRLFTKYKFSIEQLMELAGLSVAICSARTAPPGKILVCSGPGNNGGDGLVAARHLIHFGHPVDLYYPKRPAKILYQNLFESAQECGVNVVENIETFDEYVQIIDAIFGFSFNPDGGIRAPFDQLITALGKTSVPVLSVDVPSGWNVDTGPVSTIPRMFQLSFYYVLNPCIKDFQPAVNISLSAPKPCIKVFKGVNYLGGRFLPEKLIKEFDLRLPVFPAEEQIVQFNLQDVQFD